MLEDEKIDFAAVKASGFDKAAWEKEIREVYEIAADGIMAVEEKAQKNDIGQRNIRLEVIEKNWDQIQTMIREGLPKVKEMEDLFAGLDAPINPTQIDVSLQELYESVIYAKEVRPRYTVLQLIWDLGLSKKYAEATRKYFESEQAK